MPDLQKAGPGRRRILVVEDEYFIADDIARALEQHGIEVIGPAPDLSEALALLDAQMPLDGAVLDVNLRGEMIFPLADALRRRSVPFVFATGYAKTALPSAYSDVPHWEKPFDYESLVRALPGLATAV